jgi:putative endonuclease
MAVNSKTKTTELSAIPWPKSKPERQTAPVPWKIPKNTTKTQPTNKPQQTLQQQIGAQGEAQALDYLIQQGLLPVAQNFRCKCGELDLIMADGACAIVVEVRKRANDRFGSAAETIDTRKQAKVNRCAKLWWVQHGQREYTSLRFDVVTIQSETKLLWIQNAWQLPD